MDEFVVILGLLLTVLILILVYNKYSLEREREREDFSLCKGKKEKGFFQKLFDFLDSLFKPKKTTTTPATNGLNNSFTVPVDERNNLMHNSVNGKKYFWSWQ